MDTKVDAGRIALQNVAKVRTSTQEPGLKLALVKLLLF
jgi:hypothetical protein